MRPTIQFMFSTGFFFFLATACGEPQGTAAEDTESPGTDGTDGTDGTAGISDTGGGTDTTRTDDTGTISGTESDTDSDAGTDADSDSGAAFVDGVGTHFENFGSPYGGCGVPFDAIDTPDYVALNAFDTPGYYDPVPIRPPLGDPSKLGLYQDGANCGRFVEVLIGANCVNGINSGTPGVPLCSGGTWQDDDYSGATLTMQVSDECTDGNAWCRDNPNHLDLATLALNRFEKNGIAVGDLYPAHWNNRQIRWRFVEAPDYTGDIRISFVQNASAYWPAILINHLKNGIHGVEQKVNGTWVPCDRIGFLGQQVVLADGSQGTFTIRVKDASDTWINDDREYTFSFPCTGTCATVLTEAAYTTHDGS